MREYGKVAIRFWQDRRVLKLDETAKLVFLYLLTGSESNCIGCFRMTPHHLAAARVCDPERGETALRTLHGVGLIRMDEAAGIVFLPNFLRYNPLNSPAVGKGALSELMRLPDSPLLCDVASVFESQDKLPEGWREQWNARRGDSSCDEPSDTSLDEPSAPHPIPHPIPHPHPQSKHTVPSGGPTEPPAGLPPVDKSGEVAKLEAWRAWTEAVGADVSASDGMGSKVWPWYVQQLEECLTAYYGSRGGRLTPTRRAYIAHQLGRLEVDPQFYAIEVFCDQAGEQKDERYLAGIARRMSRLSTQELEREVDQHRSRFNGRGLWSGRPK